MPKRVPKGRPIKARVKGELMKGVTARLKRIGATSLGKKKRK